MIVADSDVLIDFLRGGPSADRIALELRSKQLATTAITVFELRSGCKSERQQRHVEDLLAAMNVLPLGARESSIAAGFRVALEKQGKGIGMADYLIAGICKAHDHVLLTRNLAHFQRLVSLGLKLSDEPG
jgi:tRNA(fMet)-specific endonuclease VapC